MDSLFGRLLGAMTLILILGTPGNAQEVRMGYELQSWDQDALEFIHAGSLSLDWSGGPFVSLDLGLGSWNETGGLCRFTMIYPCEFQRFDATALAMRLRVGMGLHVFREGAGSLSLNPAVGFDAVRRSLKGRRNGRSIAHSGRFATVGLGIVAEFDPTWLAGLPLVLEYRVSLARRIALSCEDCVEVYQDRGVPQSIGLGVRF